MLYSDVYKSPIGSMYLLMNEKGEVVEISFHRRDEKAEKRPGLFEGIKKQLSEYFDGRRKEFDIKFSFSGTDFQKKVWKALLDIPYGKTESYGSIARRIGHPGAYRAVGTAVGKNRLGIVVPCHRVIKGDGSIGNYGGGVDRKEFLLKLEGLKF